MSDETIENGHGRKKHRKKPAIKLDLSKAVAAAFRDKADERAALRADCDTLAQSSKVLTEAHAKQVQSLMDEAEKLRREHREERATLNARIDTLVTRERELLAEIRKFSSEQGEHALGKAVIEDMAAQRKEAKEFKQFVFTRVWPLIEDTGKSIKQFAGPMLMSELQEGMNGSASGTTDRVAPPKSNPDATAVGGTEVTIRSPPESVVRIAVALLDPDIAKQTGINRKDLYAEVEAFLVEAGLEQSPAAWQAARQWFADLVLMATTERGTK